MKKQLIFVALLFCSISYGQQCTSGDCSDGFGVYSYSDGEIYTGEWRDDKRDGQGALTYGSKTEFAGDIYTGDWRDDKRDGQGTFTYGSKTEFAGDIYTGEWRNDKRHGQGTYTYASGEQYIGDFENGKSHGQGTYTFASGSQYVGDFEDGKIQGQGTFSWPDGDYYKGEFKDDQRHGQGTLYFEGKVYIGEFKNNLYDGQGTLTYREGIKYFGAFKNGEIHGQGAFIDADGNVDIGEWSIGKSIKLNDKDYPIELVEEDKNGFLSISKEKPEITLFDLDNFKYFDLLLDDVILDVTIYPRACLSDFDINDNQLQTLIKAQKFVNRNVSSKSILNSEGKKLKSITIVAHILM